MDYYGRVRASNEAEAKHLEAEYRRLLGLGFKVDLSGRNATAPGEWDYILHIHADSADSLIGCLRALKPVQ